MGQPKSYNFSVKIRQQQGLEFIKVDSKDSEVWKTLAEKCIFNWKGDRMAWNMNFPHRIFLTADLKEFHDIMYIKESLK